MPYDSPLTRFLRQKSQRNFNVVTPNGGTKYMWGRLQSAIFDQYLAIYQKRCEIGTLLWNANRNSYVLYRMTLATPNHPILDIIYRLLYLRSGWR